MTIGRIRREMDKIKDALAKRPAPVELTDEDLARRTMFLISRGAQPKATTEDRTLASRLHFLLFDTPDLSDWLTKPDAVGPIVDLGGQRMVPYEIDAKWS